MRIEYLLTSDDYLQYYLYFQSRRIDRILRSRWYRPAMVAGWLVVTALAFALAFAACKGLSFFHLASAFDDNRIIAVIAGIVAVAFAIAGYFYPWKRELRYYSSRYIRSWVRKRERQDRLLAGYRCELTLSASEIVLGLQKESTEEGVKDVVRLNRHMPWTDVEVIEECERHGFILTRTSTGVIIPKGAFADILHFRAFVQAARDFSAGRGSTAITAMVPPAATPTGIQENARS